MCQEDKPIRDDHTSITLDHTIQTADKRPTKNKQATKLWSNWFHSDKIKINLQNMKQWWKIKFFKEAHEKPGHTVHAALCLLFETIYLFWKTYKRNQVFFTTTSDTMCIFMYYRFLYFMISSFLGGLVSLTAVE